MHGEIGIEAEGLGEIAGVRAGLAGRTPKTSAVPEVASITPARIWNVDVLPAPSGPIRPKISPCSDFQIDTAHGFERAVALSQIAHGSPA